jgi:hypothetical protein
VALSGNDLLAVMNHRLDRRFLRDLVATQDEIFLLVKLGGYFVDSTSTEALSTVLLLGFPVDRHRCGVFSLSRRVALAKITAS